MCMYARLTYTEAMPQQDLTVGRPQRPLPYLARYKCAPGNAGTQYSADGCREFACTWSEPAGSPRKVPAFVAGVVQQSFAILY